MGRPKFLVLGLCFWTHTSVREELKSFLDLDEEVDIVLLENPSPYSEKMGEMICEFGKKWRGYFRHIVYDQNLCADVFRRFYLDNKDLFAQYDYVILTEMDITVDKGLWDSVRILSSPQHFVGAVPVQSRYPALKEMGICNGVPYKQHSYSDPNTTKFTGVQFLSIPMDALRFYLETQYAVLDFHLGRYAMNKGYKWIVPSYEPIDSRDWILKNYDHVEDIATYMRWRAENINGPRSWMKQEKTPHTKVVSDIHYQK